MSALARFFLSEDLEVIGSDNNNSDLIEELKKEGVKIFLEQKKGNITQDIDLFVYSEAIPENNPERTNALKYKIPQKSYFQALGDVSKEYKTVAIAGTHGKSTTTAMAGLAIKNSTVFVGTKIFEWNNKNFRKDKSDLLIVEACEYRNSFLNLDPYVAIITSLEPEHLDFFKTKENYFASFKKFIKKAKILIADFSDPAIKKISKNFAGKKINSADFISHVPKLKIPGEHNIQNASRVLALCDFLGINLNKTQKYLSEFKGTWRRMEKKAKNVYDDYAHHPTEIRATLKALRNKYPDKKIWCVFQPHQYSRTIAFFDEFAKSFNDADYVFIPNIYKVRDSEEDVKKITAKDLVKKIGKKAQYTENFENTVKILKEKVDPNDILITMGAGPINEVAEEFLK